ncbi:MAG: hypothetical protein KN64_03665 [Sulfurovum sp. AS07-7]|nr:MAG: hypothetical protein KN64_03665 [Sulfurovum sp. AS07-7]
MTIIKDVYFMNRLYIILRYIARDKKSASKKFENELNQKIKALIDSPYKYRASYYFESNEYRDLIYHGYTIIYKVQSDKILVLDIFKWQEK